MQHKYELGLMVLCTKHHTVCFIAAIAIYGWKLPPSLAKWVYLVSYQNYNIGHEIWWLSCFSQPSKVPLTKPCEELYEILQYISDTFGIKLITTSLYQSMIKNQIIKMFIFYFNFCCYHSKTREVVLSLLSWNCAKNKEIFWTFDFWMSLMLWPIEL